MNKNLVAYLVSWAINVALLWLLATFVLKGSVVLGNARLSTLTAAVLSGLILTVITSFVRPAVKASGFKVKGMMYWIAIYYAVTVVGLWLIKRFAEVIGLGIASILHVLIVAVVIVAVQSAVAKYTMPKD